MADSASSATLTEAFLGWGRRLYFGQQLHCKQADTYSRDGCDPHYVDKLLREAFDTYEDQTVVDRAIIATKVRLRMLYRHLASFAACCA